ncbi:methyltransferase family [Fusarium longipes]|uniref:Methyltransferase family n=1 Tax=Fusarium longipes TaxID=694270 RepID=A0A395RSL9_9HYPO|nr:methyltransferase family [Fusarium longipes]
MDGTYLIHKGNSSGPIPESDSHHAQTPIDADEGGSIIMLDAQKVLLGYLEDNVEEYRRLKDLRKRGWQSSRGDDHFMKQRRHADLADEKKSQFFYTMMRDIAVDLDNETGALTGDCLKIERILDMCAAPGGFIDQTMAMCHGISHVRAMSLPVKQGGHEIRMENKDVAVEFRDITMLAGDMSVIEQDIPDAFPDRDGLVLDKVFSPDEKYHLVFCDGQVLRTHTRSEWREGREATRLTVTQLALGLEHLEAGGTMVILMHKLDSWRSFDLIYQFSKIARVSLFKRPKHHKTRSSFYLVAQGVESSSPCAKTLVEEWKGRYKVATFGSEEQYVKMHKVSKEIAESGIEEFGTEYVKMGTKIWKTQADGLENARFMKGTG